MYTVSVVRTLPRSSFRMELGGVLSAAEPMIGARIPESSTSADGHIHLHHPQQSDRVLVSGECSITWMCVSHLSM